MDGSCRKFLTSHQRTRLGEGDLYSLEDAENTPYRRSRNCPDGSMEVIILNVWGGSLRHLVSVEAVPRVPKAIVEYSYKTILIKQKIKSGGE